MARTRNDRESREARERLRVYQARQTVHQGQRTRRLRDNVLAAVGVLVLVGLASTAQVLYFTSGPGAPTPSSSASGSPAPSASASASAGTNVGDIPSPSTAEGKTWTGTLTLNDIALKYSLDGKQAPQAVAVWLQEVKQGYFDGKTCHRVVTGSLIQCGSEDGKGTSETDFSFGPIENAPSDQSYPAGTIALARAGDNGYSQGHQFFIVTKDTPLPNDSAGGYTIFGRVTSNLDSLASGIVDKGTTDPQGDGAPTVPTTITSVTVS